MPARTVALCVAILVLNAGPLAKAGPLRIPEAQIEPVLFADLDGWLEDNHAAALAAFGNSCKPILRRQKAKVAAKPFERALRAPCEKLATLKQPTSASEARIYFEQHFRPLRITKVGEKEGFITGYYEPEIEGSRTPGNGFTVPIYREPPELSKPAGRSKRSRMARRRATPFHDRTAIENGALAGRDLEICWLSDEIEAFFTHIQGSARVRLRDGSLLRINYSAQNGHPYFAVGRELIERGIVPRDEMSMDKIRTFIAEHPEQGRELMRMNRSYIFFREVKELAADEEPVGAQGVSLTRGRSIAVDRSLHTYGTLFWIDAQLPLERDFDLMPFRRLVVAQDTGGAIVGPARADVYFGAGIEAGTIAGRLRHPGTFYILVPRSLDPAQVAVVPLPPKRPKP